MVRVTFVAGDLPPSTVWIPKDEYSEDRLRAEIRTAIWRRKQGPPEEIEI